LPSGEQLRISLDGRTPRQRHNNKNLHNQSVDFTGYRWKVTATLKSVEEFKVIHEAQLLTYMKLAGVKTGLLINFNVTKLKNGIKRFVLQPFVLFVSFVVKRLWAGWRSSWLMAPAVEEKGGQRCSAT
jgi:hypothetical protein